MMKPFSSSSPVPQRRNRKRKPFYLMPLLEGSLIEELSDGFLEFSKIDCYDERVTIKKSALEYIDGSRLFYPCSGSDLEMPLALFSPFIREFLFADITFGREEWNLPDDPESGPGILDLSSQTVDCFPRMKAAFTLLGSELEGSLRAKLRMITEWQEEFRNWTERKEYQDLDPATMTETYRHRYSRKHIKIVRRRGFGFTTLKEHVDTIGVFFYRGDSLGDGGSGNLWLARSHFQEVLAKLRNGGLIVTDGSNHGHGDTHYHDSRDNREYASLWSYHGRYGFRPNPLPEPFEDRLRNRFECVGYAGQRCFGPVLIWQVWKPEDSLQQSSRTLQAKPSLNRKSAKLETLTSHFTEGDSARVPSQEFWKRSSRMALERGDLEVLVEFLGMDLSSPEEVFMKFGEIPNAKHVKGEGKYQEFVYVEGNREDRVLLIAHADTVWDPRYSRCRAIQAGYQNLKPEHVTDSIVQNPTGGLGADDRAGCAIMWLLKDLGHSILITDGEEEHQTGSEWIRSSHDKLFKELNAHRFAIQLDRKDGKNYVYYQVWTEKFEEYVSSVAGVRGYTRANGTRSDIAVLCEKICGVNLSIGYHDAHTDSEKLVIGEWLETLSLCRSWLKEKEELPAFRR